MAESIRNKGPKSRRGHGAARAGNAMVGGETGARRRSKATASGYACWAWGARKEGGLKSWGSSLGSSLGDLGLVLGTEDGDVVTQEEEQVDAAVWGLCAVGSR